MRETCVHSNIVEIYAASTDTVKDVTSIDNTR
jgi:hypothetical protein